MSKVTIPVFFLNFYLEVMFAKVTHFKGLDAYRKCYDSFCRLYIFNTTEYILRAIRSMANYTYRYFGPFF